MDDRTELLHRGLAAAERTIDAQIRRAQDLVRWSERILTVAIATMAGAITILIFLAQDRDFNVDHREAALFGAGVAATVILIALMLAGQAGVPGDLEI